MSLWTGLFSMPCDGILRSVRPDREHFIIWPLFCSNKIVSHCFCGAVRISSRAVRVFPALSPRRVRPSYRKFFLIIFQGNCARGHAGHMIMYVIKHHIIFEEEKKFTRNHYNNNQTFNNVFVANIMICNWFIPKPVNINSLHHEINILYSVSITGKLSMPINSWNVWGKKTSPITITTTITKVSTMYW